MKVYHGSYLAIDHIDLSKCKPRKDFGRAFYVTKFRRQADFWAERIGENHNTHGVVTEFEFDEFAYDEEMLNILRFDQYNEAWLDFVVANRSAKSKEQTHSYDIVEGPVADDDVTRRINHYLRGGISKIDFLKELTYHQETHQIAFCTVKSLLMLERTDFSGIMALEKIAENIVEQLMIDRNLSEQAAADIFYNSAVHTQLSTTTIYQKEWTEIYKMLIEELQHKR